MSPSDSSAPFPPSQSGHGPDHKPVHQWLRKVNLAFVPGWEDVPLNEAATTLLQQFRADGHTFQPHPDATTDAIFTTARFGHPVPWQEALLFSSLRKFNLTRTPTIYTLVHARPTEFRALLDHFEHVLHNSSPEASDYDFPGLGPGAHRVLFDQGRRGGPMVALERLVQAQARSIRVLLFVGEDRPEDAYHFDMVGGHPRSDGPDLFEDAVLRILSVLSTKDIKEHTLAGRPVSKELWKTLETPPAMCRAGRELGERGFFSDMIRVGDLMDLPDRFGRAFTSIIAAQYSEGCFATWEPRLGGLMTTITGVARPFDKDKLTEHELAVITGVGPDRMGSVFLEVEDKHNDPPSSEAVALIDMDRDLPRIDLGASWTVGARVPVARSKLHGHRGVAAFDPSAVEFVPLDPPYHHYPVTCGTQAEAIGVREAFSHSETLRNPSDQRPVAFTILPGHGVILIEKWVEGKEPFQVIWELMDSGALVIESAVPQGPICYVDDGGGVRTLCVP